MRRAWDRQKDLEARSRSAAALAAVFVLIAGGKLVGWVPAYVATTAAALALVSLIAAWRFVVESRNAGLAAAAHEDELRRERAPERPVNLLDPTQIGVDPAAQTILDGGRVPAYVARKIDDRLQGAVSAALAGNGSWLVVVTGPSKVGKSRALFEALKRCSLDVPLSLIAPEDSDALSAVVDDERDPSPDGLTPVLWLDDLEPFLNTGVRLAMLARWHTISRGGIVAATYGGKGSELVAGTTTGGLSTIASEVLAAAHEISLETTTAEEIDDLRSTTSAEEFASVERHGLAAYLVAAPQLERKLSTRRHALGEDAYPEGRAVVDAVVDWARCGRTDAIAEQTLKQLWSSYLHPELLASDETFDRAVAWALRPVAGTIALVHRATGGLQPFDYIVRVVTDAPEASPPADAAWQAATHDVTDERAISVGESAYKYRCLDIALQAYEAARTSSQANIAATAGHNVGVVLGELDRRRDQLAVYGDVLDHFSASPEPPVQKTVALVLYNRGVALHALGQTDAAIDTYDDLVARFSDLPTNAVLEAIAKALFNKAGMLAETDPAAAIEVYDDLLARLDIGDSDALDDALRKTLESKAICLVRLDRVDEALDSLDDLIEVFDGIAPYQGRVVRAAYYRGVLLGVLDRLEDSIEAYNIVITRYGDDPEHRALVARACIARERAEQELARREREDGDEL
jgi:tetratricopeptide (TPR) repeat protein